MGLAEAASLVKSGASISIGGFTSQRHPTALLRRLVRQNVRDLIVYYHSAGSDVDLLIGAGCVRRLEGAYLADGVFAPIAPNFRRFAQAGKIEIEDYSNAAMMPDSPLVRWGCRFCPPSPCWIPISWRKRGSHRNFDEATAGLRRRR